MADPRPTRGQWKAIRELEKHLSVSAGAGAGKTWVLTERYTTMLAGRPLVLPPEEWEAEEALRPTAEPSRPQQIVAITFTKEAAGEMKARIRGRLSKWKREASASGAEAELRRIALLKEEVERATITTIHGYCSELLREYPLEAGVDPHFAVLEESAARLWLDESVREVLDEGLATEQEAVIRLVDEYGYESLVGHLARFYLSVREQTEDFAKMADDTMCTLNGIGERLESSVDRLEVLLQNIAQVDLSKKDTSKGSAKRALELQQAWPMIAQHLQEWRVNGFAYHEEIATLLQDLPKGWGVLIKELKQDVPPMKQLVGEMCGQLVPTGLQDAVRFVCQLLESVHALYTAKKDKERALDFTDLQNRAVRLLGHETVRQRQAERLRFLMVDEFQDTNPVQKDLLDALTAGNPHLRLFVVGDAKQSIYRFRGADLEVFMDTQKDVLDKQGEHIALLENFRTQQPIINFVNHLFACLMPAQEAGPRYATQYEPMTPTRQSEHGNPMVEILHLTPNGDSAQNKLREAEAIARRIRRMVGQEALVPSAEGLRPVQYRDITLLFSAMSHVSVYEYALQSHGIPYYIVGSRHFYRRQEVIDLVQLLQAIVEERDLLALIGALRSPLFGLSDEALYWLGREGLAATDWRETANWLKIAANDQGKLLRAMRDLQQWRAEKAFKSAGDLLSRILQMTGYEQALLLTFGGSQKVGNVRKLLDLAYEQPADRAGVVPFLQYLQMMIDEGVNEEDAQVESDTSDVVKIMTVHKSKGLEFPVVILPDMAREFNTRTEGKFQYDPKLGLAVSFAEHEEWNEFGFAPELRELDKQKAKEEERRKLYVAMTRARDYLLLVGTIKEPSKPMSLEASRWFDWLVAAMADGQLSQMEGVIQTEWPEVKWLTEEDVPPLEDEQQKGPQDGLTDRLPDFSAWSEIAAAAGNMALDALDEVELTTRRQQAFPLLCALTPQAGQVPGVLLSVSALMTYLTCPRQYFYKYEWKLPERRRETARPEEETVEWEPAHADSTDWNADVEPELQARHLQTDLPHEATERGTLVHRVLEWVQSPEEADELIRRALAERGLGGEAADKWVPELQKNVETYLQSDLFREVQAAKEQQSELKFRLVLGKHEITGIVDKVIQREDGSAVVIDYKTNRSADDKTVTHYKPQLQLYTLVANRLLGWPVERAVLYFTALGKEIRIPTAEHDLQALEATVRSACDHMAAHDLEEDFPQAQDDSPCTYCGYRFLCKGEK